MGTFLNPCDVEAWDAAGDCWCAVSSRIVIAWLKLASVGSRQEGGGRCSCEAFLTVVSVYAPTVRAPRHVKETVIYKDV